MSLKKLDKKQVPQFAALCVLSGGLFGYFVIRIVTPTSAAAGTRVAAPAPAVSGAAAPAAGPAPAVKAGAAGVAGAAGAVAPGAAVTDAAVPPTPNMRDPFVVGYAVSGATPAPSQAVPAAPTAAPSAPKMLQIPAPHGVQVASIREAAPLPPAPPAPALPPIPAGFAVRSMGYAPALPVARTTPAPPAPPRWTVTGVLQGGAGQVAILRDGEARRFVRAGDAVDSVYRVVDVTRTSVVLRHGATVYALALGAAAPSAGGRLDPAAPRLLPALRKVSARVASPAVTVLRVVLPRAAFSHVVLPDPVVLTASDHVLTLPPPQVGLRFLAASRRPAGPEEAGVSLVANRTPDDRGDGVGKLIGH
jgi:hypothetical protein